MLKDLLSKGIRRQGLRGALLLAVFCATPALRAGQLFQSVRSATTWHSLQADATFEYFAKGASYYQNNWRLLSDGQGQVALFAADRSDGQWVRNGRYYMKTGGRKFIDHPMTSGSPALALLQLVTLNQVLADASTIDKEEGDQLWLRLPAALGGGRLQCTLDKNGRISEAKVGATLVTDIEFSTVGSTQVLSSFVVRPAGSNRQAQAKTIDGAYKVSFSNFMLDGSLSGSSFEP